MAFLRKVCLNPAYSYIFVIALRSILILYVLFQNNLVSIIRAHEVQERGFSEHFQFESAPPLLTRPGGGDEEQEDEEDEGGKQAVAPSQEHRKGAADLSAASFGFPKASFPYESVSLEVEQQKQGSMSKVPFYSMDDNAKRLPLGEWSYI